MAYYRSPIKVKYKQEIDGPIIVGFSLKMKQQQQQQQQNLQSLHHPFQYSSSLPQSLNASDDHHFLGGISNVSFN